MALEELTDGKSLFSTALSYLGFGSLASLGLALLSRGTKNAEGKDIFDFLPAPAKKFIDGIADFINGWIDKASSWLAGLLGFKTPAAATTPAPASTSTSTPPETSVEPLTPGKTPPTQAQKPIQAHR